MIIDIEKSKKPTKRLRVTMDNGKTFDFGLKGGNTYIEHHDIDKRRNYFKRHMGNPTEFQLISNLVPSASLFSAIILWGPYTNIVDNVNYLNEIWKLKHSGIKINFLDFL